jgi:hypothetical protein
VQEELLSFILLCPSLSLLRSRPQGVRSSAKISSLSLCCSDPVQRHCCFVTVPMLLSRRSSSRSLLLGFEGRRRHGEVDHHLRWCELQPHDWVGPPRVLLPVEVLRPSSLSSCIRSTIVSLLPNDNDMMRCSTLLASSPMTMTRQRCTTLSTSSLMCCGCSRHRSGRCQQLEVARQAVAH